MNDEVQVIFTFGSPPIPRAQTGLWESPCHEYLLHTSLSKCLLVLILHARTGVLAVILPRFHVCVFGLLELLH